MTRILEEQCVLYEHRVIDYPGCNLLTQKYLEAVEITTVKFQSLLSLSRFADYDLVICLRLFAESSRKEQEEYLDRVILNSKAGYMFCRETSESYGPKELIQILDVAGYHVAILKDASTVNHYILAWLKVK